MHEASCQPVVWCSAVVKKIFTNHIECLSCDFLCPP